MGHTRTRAAVALILLWSIPALLMVSQMQASAYIEHRPWAGFAAIFPALVEWYIWAPLTPLVFGLVRRFPVWPRPSATAVIVHAAGIVAATVIRGVAYAWATYMIGKLPVAAIPSYLLRVSLGWLPVAALVYGSIVLGAVALHSLRRMSRSEVRAAELETALARAESASLRAQLDPHFLFNGLHSVGALVRAHDVNGAVQMLTDLGDLLRESLSRRDTEQVPLRDELRFAERYLAIEHTRFRDRLVVEWDIDASTLDVLVPRLMLQPIVENAIRHGIAKRSASGRVAVCARRTGESLLVSVTDDGAGVPTETAPPDGVGLGATRRRLHHYFGDAASLSLRSASAPTGHGAVAEIRLPFASARDEGRGT